MTRITPAFVDAQAATASRLTGQNIQAYRAYGGTGVHHVHDDTSHSSLLPCGPAREASSFLAGMIAAARLCPALP